MNKNKKKDPAVEALAKLANEETDEQTKQSARSFASWFLKQPAVGKNGSALTLGDRELTNMDLGIMTLFKRADPYSITTVLSLAGVMQSENKITEEEQKRIQEASKKRKEEIRRHTHNIRRQYQHDGMYKSSLLPLIKELATLEVDVAILEDKTLSEPVTLHTASREGAERVLTNPALKELRQLRKDMSKANTELLKYARRLKLDDERNDDDEPLYNPVELKIMKLLADEPIK